MQSSLAGIRWAGPVLTAIVVGFLAAPVAGQSKALSDKDSPLASHEGAFRKCYPRAEALFNAFDYADAVLHERLASDSNNEVSHRDTELYARLAGDVLRGSTGGGRLSDEKIMPTYARLAPKATQIVASVRMLQRQIYDIYADDRVTDKVVAVDGVVDRYLSHTTIALPSTPKSMAIVDEQRAERFRELYPKITGLSWAYNWLQLAVLDPLTVYTTSEERQAGVQATVERFWQMLSDPPRSLPSHMPMAPTIAPDFVRRHPRAAAIFDNMNMMHDEISGLVVSRGQESAAKQAIDDAINGFMDPRRLEIDEMEWLVMSLRHGIWAQGGPAIGTMQGSERNLNHSSHGQSGTIRRVME